MRSQTKKASALILALRALIVTVLVLILLMAGLQSGFLIRGEDTPPQQVEEIMGGRQTEFQE